MSRGGILLVAVLFDRFRRSKRVEHGTHCIPMACWRDGDRLYVHGSNGSRLLRCAAAGMQVVVRWTTTPT